jgi:hypothetical protein
MKKILILLIAPILFSTCSIAQIDMKKVKKTAEKKIKTVTTTLPGSGALTNDEIVQGLKEALSVGSKNASDNASKTDAFYKNMRIFIPFPPEANAAAQKLRALGFGAKVDEFIKTLNRAAETAAKDAAPIFVDAVRTMSITDALGILKGHDSSATSYLKKSTNAQLHAQFKPVVQAALNKVDATKYWKDIINTYNKIPTVKKKLNPDLAAYATGKAIDGLFLLVADEEAKIRKDPAARVSDLLKKVFGKKQ